jgi:signal peptidase I
MYHKGNVFSNFNDWFNRHETKYESIDITKEGFQNFVFKNGFNKGDILFIIGANPDKLKIGDIILFKSGNRNTPVIHRIINIEKENGKRIFTTMGDNNAQILIPNNNPGGVDERKITEEQLIGKAVFRIVPGIGWIKLIFFEGSKSQSERGFCTES